MNTSNNPTKKEHYVPQFVINKFADDLGYICVIDKRNKPFKSFVTKSSAVLFENDIYETKNIDGTYYARNSMEIIFGKIESATSNLLEKLQNERYIKTELSKEQKHTLAEFISLQSIRLPFIRKHIENTHYQVIPDSERDIYNNAAYRMILESRNSGLSFLKENRFELSEEAADSLKGDNFIDFMTAFIEKECSAFIAIAAENKTFVLSDKPVLIDPFPDVHYLMPITPNIAICFDWKDISKNRNGDFSFINDKGVDRINNLICNNANRWIVCHTTNKDNTIRFLEKQEEINE